MTARVLMASALLAAAALFLSGPAGPGRLGATVGARAHAAEWPAGNRPTLYVYLHTDSKSTNLEKGLQERLTGFAVTVFGRFRDFEEAMSMRPPDGVMGIVPLLASLGIQPALQGLRGNSDTEPYVLVSSGAPLDGSLSGKVVGVVDLLGRAATQDFVSKLLRADDVKLKRVTKMEDLLPLLQFSAADAVLVPSVAVRGMEERSRLPLRVRELPEARVGLPAVGLVSGRSRDLLLRQVAGLDAETNRTLGVDRWRGR